MSNANKCGKVGMGEEYVYHLHAINTNHSYVLREVRRRSVVYNTTGDGVAQNPHQHQGQPPPQVQSASHIETDNAGIMSHRTTSKNATDELPPSSHAPTLTVTQRKSYALTAITLIHTSIFEYLHRELDTHLRLEPNR